MGDRDPVQESDVVLTRARHRYDSDPVFHARVELTVDVMRHLHSMAPWSAVREIAMVALVIAEDGPPWRSVPTPGDRFIGASPPLPPRRPFPLGGHRL